MAGARILVSACLLGERVRYHGGDAATGDARLARWMAEGRIVPFCPEVAGGLSTPRPPAEIAGPGGGAAVLRGTARVRTAAGADVTGAFVHGAEAALDAARTAGVRLAILKDGSPSCATTRLADGSFSGRAVAGLGVAAARLAAAGIAVFSERQIDDAAEYLARVDDECPAGR